MIPVANNRTTPFDVGDIIRKRRNPIGYYPSIFSKERYKIMLLSTCSISPCEDCPSDNITYVARKFNKRIGRKDIHLCPCGSRFPWEKVEEEITNDTHSE